ncbi:MAG TPA: hypothetical protein VNK82_12660 [Terriglobales bacterium]|nr:hypothetical protein [Terriglobales bacterium]
MVPTADRLTRKQRTLVRELEEISELLGLDWGNIKSYEKASRTPHLERMKDHLIRGEVITQYTLIDEHLGGLICRYFFPRRSFVKLWRTKKFRNFNYYVIEPLSLMEKLRLVKAIKNVPRGVASAIERVNGLRNGLAHAFFPENLRGSKPIYKGKDVFTLEGLKLFMEDMEFVHEFFLVN